MPQHSTAIIIVPKFTARHLHQALSYLACARGLLLMPKPSRGPYKAGGLIGNRTLPLQGTVLRRHTIATTGSDYSLLSNSKLSTDTLIDEVHCIRYCVIYIKNITLVHTLLYRVALVTKPVHREPCMYQL